MRKPTAKVFFTLEVAAWAMLVVTLIARDPSHALFYFAVANLCVAIFNVLGMWVGLLTHWYPWRDSP